ncbi:2-Oxobutyrate oxidase, putative [Klebsiella variicola]|uniref:2-Oxobutyrate oxidase, putative n=1 Tax=Klebsiella variicola TaxID=244366 RepID=A0A7H4MQQ8_KLEVA|nr:2-Oxobutyrate oxidase, putative [Klebsiella variicola]
MTAVKHAFTELPTIDIRDLAGDDLARRQAVADAIGRAAREVGFFYITGHGIDPALIAGVREAAKQIFALPMEEKMNYYIGHSKSHKGYVPEGEEIYGSGKPDHKEAFDIGFQAADDHPLVLAGTPLIGANEWPDLPDFRARVLAYYDAVFALGHRLFDAFRPRARPAGRVFQTDGDLPAGQAAADPLPVRRQRRRCSRNWWHTPTMSASPCCSPTSPALKSSMKKACGSMHLPSRTPPEKRRS